MSEVTGVSSSKQSQDWSVCVHTEFGFFYCLLALWKNSRTDKFHSNFSREKLAALEIDDRPALEIDESWPNITVIRDEAIKIFKDLLIED